MADRMPRLLVLGGALALLPRAAAAAPTRLPRIGFLLAGAAEAEHSRRYLREFREGLGELGRDRYVPVVELAARRRLDGGPDARRVALAHEVLPRANRLHELRNAADVPRFAELGALASYGCESPSRVIA